MLGLHKTQERLLAFRETPVYRLLSFHAGGVAGTW
jgi:hypothetical protein